MAQYYTTANGNVRLAAKPNPCPYSDPENPHLTPSEVLRRDRKAEAAALGENCALLRRASLDRGEGHDRENKPWEIGQHKVTMGEIDSESALLDWLLQPGLVEKVTTESTDTGLHTVCYRLCMEDVRFLRVHQRERHHSVAMEAAANAANLLWQCVLSPESTVRVRGKYEGKTLLAATLEASAGKFPIMRLVGWLCSLETMSELNRTRLDYDDKKAAALTRHIENAQLDMESESDLDAWIGYLAKSADDEKARHGTETLRQDMFLLYRFLRLNAKSEAANAQTAGNVSGNISREKVQAELGWSKSYLARVKMELMISRAYWTRPESEARKTEQFLREKYRDGYIGKKGAKVCA